MVYYIYKVRKRKYLPKGTKMEEIGMTDLQYKDMLRKQIREYERIKELGVSKEAESEIDAEIARMRKAIED
jgi:hypothetical protein